MVQAGATLKQADLQKNGVASVEALYDLVYNGKGKMPGYGAGCTPKVLSLVLLVLAGSVGTYWIFTRMQGCSMHSTLCGSLS